VRRAALVALFVLMPAMTAQAVVVRVAVFSQAGTARADRKAADHAIERTFPGELDALWSDLGTSGISLDSVDRFKLAAGEERDTDRTHIRLVRLGGSKGRVDVRVNGATGDFSLPIPYGETMVLTSPAGAQGAEWIAVSIFDDAAGEHLPEIFRVGGEVVAPRAVSRVEPLYPEDARAQNISGIVIMELLIDERGVPVSAHVLKELPLLTGAAIDAVKRWRFQPATKDGKPVAALFNLTIQFKLH
jgi:TonB family protein